MEVTNKTTKEPNKENKKTEVIQSSKKRLSKIGQWLSSGGPIEGIIDMKAVLK